MSIKDEVNKVFTDIIKDPIKRKFFAVLNDKNYKRENYISDKNKDLIIRKGDLVSLIDGRRGKVTKNSSNSAIFIQLFDEDGKFTEEMTVISKSEIEKKEEQI